MLVSYPKRHDQVFERGGLGGPCDLNPYKNDAVIEVSFFAREPVIQQHHRLSNVSFIIQSQKSTWKWGASGVKVVPWYLPTHLPTYPPTYLAN